jgi:outer membrane protein assembly factor BamD
MASDHTGAAVGARSRDSIGSTRIERIGRRLSAVAAIGLAAVIAAACSGAPKTPPTGTPEPDKFLFERGTETLNAKKWLTAREYFRQLVDSYPQSRYRADAKLGIGDTFLGERSAESFVLAANEFREFLSFYPTHERADYAQYKLGMTYFYQMHAPERDQTQTKEAIKELTTFVERYSTSGLIQEGRQHLREARDRLSDSEYRVGYFYFRTQKWWPGAIERLTGIIQSDPGYTRRDAVYYYLGESLLKVNRPAEALPYFDRLIAEFETSEFLDLAKKRAAELKDSMKKAGGA